MSGAAGGALATMMVMAATVAPASAADQAGTEASFDLQEEFLLEGEARNLFTSDVDNDGHDDVVVHTGLAEVAWETLIYAAAGRER
jgi:hypothetical protein